MNLTGNKTAYFNCFVDTVLEMMVLEDHTMQEIAKILEIKKSELNKILMTNKKEMTFEVLKKHMDKLEKYLKA